MHILSILEDTGWRLGGPRGAATRLGMKRTTLQSMITRLGITRPRAASVVGYPDGGVDVPRAET